MFIVILFKILIFLKVILKPEDVLPEGLFESDIVLDKEQAYTIFSQYLSNNNTREKRKVLRDVTGIWPMPITFMFDGTHSINI